MSQVAIIKLPKGQNPPMGYTPVRELRNAVVYHKVIQTVTENDMDELTNMFQSNVSVALIPVNQEDDFINQLASMTLGGKSRKRKNLKKSRKSRKHRH